MKPTKMLLLTIILTGLAAGVFYTWSVSVIPGLARLSDRDYVVTFQSFNRAILNPLFFISFLGAAIILPVSTWMAYSQPLSTRCWLLLAATVCYLLGVIAITFAGNIPLNNLLENFNTSSATEADFSSLRNRIEIPWNRLNHIRSLFSIAAFACTVAASLTKVSTQAQD